MNGCCGAPPRFPFKTKTLIPPVPEVWWLFIAHKCLFVVCLFLKIALYWRKLPYLRLCLLSGSVYFQAWNRKSSFLKSEHLSWVIPTLVLPIWSAKAFVANASWFNFSRCSIQFPLHVPETILQYRPQLKVCFPRELSLQPGGDNWERWA